MGNGPLRPNGNDGDFCADANRALFDQPTMLTFTKAVNDGINWMRLNKMKPGSAKWFGRKFDTMRRLVGKNFYALCGEHMSDCTWFSEALLREHWELCRKHGDQLLKHGKLLATDSRPLFDGIESAPGAIVYAYAGTIPTVRWRVVKLGYTGQPLERYLRSKRLTHLPVLLASTSGDKLLEAKYLFMWRHLIADGNEWFHPDRTILEWIKTVFLKVEPTFKRTADLLHAEYTSFSTDG